jgi:methylthioribulose-1-phosphate dehydratase
MAFVIVNNTAPVQFIMSENFQQLAEGLATTASGFYSRGWVLGTSGNFSAVVRTEPLVIAISQSGVDKGTLCAEQILEIDDKIQIVGNNLGRPSDESRLHVEVIKETGAGAVFHTHSVWSTILSDLVAAEGGVILTGFEMLKGLSGTFTHEHREWIPVFENSQDMSELADTVCASLRRSNGLHGFLLRRHGLYSWGKDIVEAKRHIEILEFLFEVIGRELLAGIGR